jgi:CheY-like chemotaxis protein
MAMSVAPTRASLRVVLVDDREERRQLVRLALRGTDADPVEVSEADGAAAALQALEADGADVVLLEIRMQGALALIASLRSRHPELVIAVCSFHTGSDIEQLALDAGADSYLRKPVRREDLHRLTAERALSV